MADRFSMRHDAVGHDEAMPPRQGQSDPLAELARLIGQSDPMADFPHDDRVPLSPRHAAEPQPEYEPQPSAPEDLPPGPPRWVQHRTGWRRATPVAPEPVVQPEADAYGNEAYDSAYDDRVEPDLTRYDEALYGHAGPAQIEDAPYLAEGAYGDGAYGYDEGYDAAEQDDEPRRGKKLAVLAILALAVVGTGGAYAYRSFSVASAPAEPPVIKAETAPVKVVPPTQAAERKLVQDRLASAGGAERLVPREEAPVDVTSKTQGEPRIVFPPLTRNAAPATVAAVSSGAQSQPAPAAGSEPRRIRTVPVRPDQPGAAQTPAQAAAAAPRAANPPVALAPDSQTRTASINPTAEVPVTSGGYLVQVSSQRSDADARASYRVLQGKFPSVLGNHAPVIKRAELGTKGVHYRAMVGPFGNHDQAAQFCGNLKAAGGQCFVQRN